MLIVLYYDSTQGVMYAYNTNYCIQGVMYAYVIL